MALTKKVSEILSWYSSENAGLVKFDLLGLKTLTVIDKTIKRL